MLGDRGESSHTQFTERRYHGLESRTRNGHRASAEHHGTAAVHAPDFRTQLIQAALPIENARGWCEVSEGRVRHQEIPCWRALKSLTIAALSTLPVWLTGSGSL